MASLDCQNLAGRVWKLARAQHGVVALFQLLELGFTMSAIKHRVAKGRLHPVRRGVYAVGRPELTRQGEWMAAVLSCGRGAMLSHLLARALWRICREWNQLIHVSIPRDASRCQADILTHRRSALEGDRPHSSGMTLKLP